MLSRISVHEFREWRAYSDLEPWDEGRADLRAAQVVAAYVNLNRSKGATVRPITDFVLPFGDVAPKAPATWQKMKAIGQAAYKASIEGRRKRG